MCFGKQHTQLIHTNSVRFKTINHVINGNDGVHYRK